MSYVTVGNGKLSNVTLPSNATSLALRVSIREYVSPIGATGCCDCAGNAIHSRHRREQPLRSTASSGSSSHLIGKSLDVPDTFRHGPRCPRKKTSHNPVGGYPPIWVIQQRRLMSELL